MKTPKNPAKPCANPENARSLTEQEKQYLREKGRQMDFELNKRQKKNKN